MRKFREIIKRPLITEKSLRLAQAENAYTFEVSREASKGAVKEAVEKLFDVTVTAVRTVKISSKPKRALGVWKPFRTSPSKKAVVSLKEGEEIAGFELE